MSEKAKKSALDRFSRFVTNHRVAALIITLIVAAGFAVGIFRIQGEVYLEDLLPYDHPFLQIIAKFSGVFGTGGSGAMILVQSRDEDGDIFNPALLKKVQEINAEVSFWDETFRVLTYSIGSRSIQVARVGGMGDISFEPLMFPDVPETEAGLSALEKDIFSDSGIRGLVSQKGDITIVITEFKPEVTYEQAYSLLIVIID
ncbi:MAG: hypothetical protein JRH15_18185 [Deltaproteobacteria bacterium]|nr:hypothetical protein [Deltaproteobacteria bacterium]